MWWDSCKYRFDLKSRHGAQLRCNGGCGALVANRQVQNQSESRVCHQRTFISQSCNSARIGRFGGCTAPRVNRQVQNQLACRRWCDSNVETQSWHAVPLRGRPNHPIPHTKRAPRSNPRGFFASERYRNGLKSAHTECVRPARQGVGKFTSVFSKIWSIWRNLKDYFLTE